MDNANSKRGGIPLPLREGLGEGESARDKHSKLESLTPATPSSDPIPKGKKVQPDQPMDNIGTRPKKGRRSQKPPEPLPSLALRQTSLQSIPALGAHAKRPGGRIGTKIAARRRRRQHIAATFIVVIAGTDAGIAIGFDGRHSAAPARVGIWRRPAGYASSQKPADGTNNHKGNSF
jgi:hypothetical protein